MCRFVERLPRLATDDTGTFESTLTLEGDHSVVCASSKTIEVDGFDQVTSKGELAVKFDDSFTDVTALKTWPW